MDNASCVENEIALHHVIADNLARLMATEPRISQTELAERSGVPQPTISRILSAKSSGTIDTLLALANALGVPLSELVGPYEKAVSPRGSIPRKRSGLKLTALQQSVVDVFEQLVSTRQISDRECIELLSKWSDRLDPAEGTAHD